MEPHWESATAESLAYSVRAGLAIPEGLCCHQWVGDGNSLKRKFLMSGLNVAPPVHVTFASCGSLLIQRYSHPPHLPLPGFFILLAFPFWAWILDLICTLLSLALFLLDCFPGTAPGFLYHLHQCQSAHRCVIQGSGFSTRLPQAVVCSLCPSLSLQRVFSGDLPGVASHHHYSEFFCQYN